MSLQSHLQARSTPSLHKCSTASRAPLPRQPSRCSTGASCSYAIEPARRRCSGHHARRRAVAARAAEASDAAVAEAAAPAVPAADEFFEVDTLVGIRANLDGELPVVEYRVRWKDGSPDTWELPINLSPDLIRDFDERWWGAARKGDAMAMRDLLAGGAALLAQVVDDNRRSALHFVAAVGAVPCVELLLAAGADIDLQDREGYTPLHMAAGYMQTGAMQTLLQGGADPEIKDRAGKDVVALVEGLRQSMPVNAAMVQRRLALEQVGTVLTQRLYETVAPAAILASREVEGRPDELEFLVQFTDDRADEWLPARDIADDVRSDWEAGLEAAPARAVIDMRQTGTERTFLVAWEDGREDSWEPEEHVAPELVQAFAAKRPELFKSPKKRRGARRPRAPRGGDGDGGGGDAGAPAAGGGDGNGRRARSAQPLSPETAGVNGAVAKGAAALRERAARQPAGAPAG